MKKEKCVHIEYSSKNTIQHYPKILNKIGDIVSLKLKEIDGKEYIQDAEIMALYKHYVLLLVNGKYRTCMHNSEFSQCLGANVQWDKTMEE